MRWVRGWAMAAAVLTGGSFEASGQERGEREVFPSKACYTFSEPREYLHDATVVDHGKGLVHYIKMRVRPDATQNSVERVQIETSRTVSVLPLAGNVRTETVYEPTHIQGRPCDPTFFGGFWQVGDDNAVQFCAVTRLPSFRSRFLCQVVLPP